MPKWKRRNLTTLAEKFYVTTPIYYVNSHPHLGHLYTTTVADALTRFKRQRGVDAFFLTGTDEHGQNIERAAAAAGLPVEEHVEKYVTEFREFFQRFQLQFNCWSRTTDPAHKQGVTELWRRCKENGYIYKGEYSGWYCANCNNFVAETEMRPGADGVPICTAHERPVDHVSEESYFFRLSAFQQPLLDYYQSHPEFIRPDVRRNEIVSFVRGGLEDLSVSRVSVKWGVPVPDDPKHTMYVWFDALANYITAVGYGNGERGGQASFAKYWPADLHLVGKDILRFHTVYWPAFLMAAGVPLPKTVYAHGMWMSGGRRMSKTLGNVVDLNVLFRHFSRDAIRYFVLREMVFGQDGDFTYEALVNRANSDLASGLGNLFSRTLTMLRNYSQGVVPPPAEAGHELASALLGREKELVAEFEADYAVYNFSRALEHAWELIAAVDKYITECAPWNMAKKEESRAELDTVLHMAARVVLRLSVLLAPVLPDSTAEVWSICGLAGSPLDYSPAAIDVEELTRKVKIGEIRPLFPRIEKEKVMSEINTEAVAAVEVKQEAPAMTPIAPEITIEDFVKLDLRVAQVLVAERVPKADKLLRLEVDLGEGKPRQILAGIAQYYDPEKLVGRKIVVVANLAPRKLRGLESTGMLLAASVGDEGRPVVATFIEDVPNGARLK